MAQVTKNPPLTCYYLAAWSIVFGWSEVAMHAAMFLPALGLASGTYLLARRMCPESAFLAAVAATVAPVTLVSASSVMCDVPMLCFYVWAIYFHLRGIDEDRFGLLVAAAASAGAAAMLKYFGATVLRALLRRAADRLRALARQALFELRRRQRFDDHRIELRNDLARRAGRREDAKP